LIAQRGNFRQLLSVNLLVAENYAVVRKELKDRGRLIPENDIWIAAICLSHNLPLITKDKHFKEIASLTLVPHNK
jgi:tRNA(fMet)-specific endonuclease VapC